MSRSTIGILAVMWAVSSSCQPDAVSAGVCSPGVSPQFSDDWARLSDAQLQTEIERACGNVSVGFKEPSAARGVDPQGRVLTSAETVMEMKQFLLERGFIIEYQSAKLPNVAGRLTIRPGLVPEIRHHAKIDYLEPNFPGTFLAR